MPLNCSGGSILVIQLLGRFCLLGIAAADSRSSILPSPKFPSNISHRTEVGCDIHAYKQRAHAWIDRLVFPRIIWVDRFDHGDKYSMNVSIHISDSHTKTTTKLLISHIKLAAASEADLIQIRWH